jgi:hypothetical protein
LPRMTSATSIEVVSQLLDCHSTSRINGVNHGVETRKEVVSASCRRFACRYRGVYCMYGIVSVFIHRQRTVDFLHEHVDVVCVCILCTPSNWYIQCTLEYHTGPDGLLRQFVFSL